MQRNYLCCTQQMRLVAFSNHFEIKFHTEVLFNGEIQAKKHCKQVRLNETTRDSDTHTQWKQNYKIEEKKVPRLDHCEVPNHENRILVSSKHYFYFVHNKLWENWSEWCATRW